MFAKAISTTYLMVFVLACSCLLTSASPLPESNNNAVARENIEVEVDARVCRFGCD
ncbi:hypothetical protein SERLA73DRAFT_191891 [Serpula lacrymans var. lacrymans S7.3]|uniref:Uncharacterized protein n=2 Tax=Serpula lacrymans var. lacrymans TaxID=341189 RepID=F8QIJ1_SERL3|nr:uncharacterized protein SERLADRAFT_463187 [Serpula lacrymans var. lacrymans S7.9]EGN91873.1 hypothetical protein SERLA73DRAFT_191891 [Serpula lacrymans var. lacrymans S7.3]EGO26292.1 hypothetical protein SERLADRAFT_463187 [Serpula lacrymans var. lacrymans S7.9]